MTDTTTKVREHYSATGLTERIKAALAAMPRPAHTGTWVIGSSPWTDASHDLNSFPPERVLS
jgi:hypothetical protein